MMRKTYKEIWPTPIGEYWLEDMTIHDELTELVKTKYSNWNPINSMNLFDIDCRFTEWVYSCVKDFTSNFFEIESAKITRGWCMCLHPGQENFLHSHANFNYGTGGDLAVVYYVDVVEGNPPLEIMDPRAAHKFNMVERKMTDGSMASGFVSTQVPVEKHKLVLHPGYLVHGVGTNLINYPRTSVAMNVNLTRPKWQRRVVLEA
jgi:hypothetical protein